LKKNENDVKIGKYTIKLMRLSHKNEQISGIVKMIALMTGSCLCVYTARSKSTYCTLFESTFYIFVDDVNPAFEHKSHDFQFRSEILTLFGM